MTDEPNTLPIRLAELRACVCSLQSQLYFDSPTNTSDFDLHQSNFTSNTTVLCNKAMAGAKTGIVNEDYRYIEEILYTRVAVAICTFGLLGNICNLFVLVPQGRHCSMGRIEKFAYWGLVSLSVSDACCCLLVIPNVYVDTDDVYSSHLSFSLLYAVYGTPLLNVFTMVSTWLTVITAVGRYLAICHPFKAREIIGMTVAKRAGLIVYCTCFIFNIPRFFIYVIERIDCGNEYFDDDTTLFRWPGPAHAKSNPQFETAYNWAYFVCGICLPFVFLAVSNSFLVRALRRARTTLSLRRAVEVCSLDQYRSITLTLVVLVLMHVVLVSPAEFVMFFRQRLTRLSDDEDDEYNLLASVSNTLQAVNFSVNFVLYYVINVHFRRALSAMLRCRCCARCCSRCCCCARRCARCCCCCEDRRGGGNKMAAGNGSLSLHTYSVSARGGVYVYGGQLTRSESKRHYCDSAPF